MLFIPLVTACQARPTPMLLPRQCTSTVGLCHITCAHYWWSHRALTCQSPPTHATHPVVHRPQKIYASGCVPVPLESGG
jgi:hypothetical protein